MVFVVQLSQWCTVQHTSKTNLHVTPYPTPPQTALICENCYLNNPLLTYCSMSWLALTCALTCLNVARVEKRKKKYTKDAQNVRSQLWSKGKIEETANKYSCGQRKCASTWCNIHARNIYTRKWSKQTPSDRQVYFQSAQARWTPFRIFNLQENMVHRTCLTLCVVIRQPPFCSWRIIKKFSPYVQENIVYLQLV